MTAGAVKMEIEDRWNKNGCFERQVGNTRFTWSWGGSMTDNPNLPQQIVL